MAYELSQAVKATFVAQDPIEQYSFVQFFTEAIGAEIIYSNKVTKATEDSKVIGVVQNAPKAGQEAEVVLVGITKVVADNAINIGDRVKASNGRAKQENGAGWIVGRALSAAAAGEIATLAISTPSANYYVD